MAWLAPFALHKISEETHGRVEEYFRGGAVVVSHGRSINNATSAVRELVHDVGRRRRKHIHGDLRDNLVA